MLRSQLGQMIYGETGGVGIAGAWVRLRQLTSLPKPSTILRRAGRWYSRSAPRRDGTSGRGRNTVCIPQIFAKALGLSVEGHRNPRRRYGYHADAARPLPRGQELGVVGQCRRGKTGEALRAENFCGRSTAGPTAQITAQAGGLRSPTRPCATGLICPRLPCVDAMAMSGALEESYDPAGGSRWMKTGRACP